MPTSVLKAQQRRARIDKAVKIQRKMYEVMRMLLLLSLSVKGWLNAKSCELQQIILCQKTDVDPLEKPL